MLFFVFFLDARAYKFIYFLKGTAEAKCFFVQIRLVAGGLEQLSCDGWMERHRVRLLNEIPSY